MNTLPAQKEGTEAQIILEPPAERLAPRDRQVMLRYVEGQSVADIGVALGLTPAQVRYSLSKPAVAIEITRLMQLDSNRVFETRVAGLAEEALDVARDTMRGTQLSDMRWKAAKDLLDRHPSQRREVARQGAGSAAMGDAIIKRLAEMQAKALGVDIPSEDAEIVIEGETWTTDSTMNDPANTET